ncbi:MAG: multidrug efflux RND transporter permease subunit [Sterolibacterium sp.]|nr:multidrug efflux RND transporter permease subunit [Sterolibacterium sp.]
MILRQFIDRPLFACVLSIFIVIAGLAALRNLTISLYPDILPPLVEVSTAYPGASADVVAETVAAPLEQQLNGTENMLYLRSGSMPNGMMQAVLTFAIGTNPDIAVINTQNRVQAALPLLPEEVRRQGVVVRKLNWTAVQYISLDAPDGRYNNQFISNYALINIVDELRRIPGIAAVDTYGAKEYSLRIWLQPDKLAQLGLTPNDIAQAVREQNAQFATGRVGDEPMPTRVDLSMNITTQGRLSSPEAFQRIIVRAKPDGTLVRLGDVARVEMGARDNSVNSTRNAKPTLMIGIFPRPGADVLKISDNVRERMEELSKRFPQGLHWDIPFDTTSFVRVAIKEVFKTLGEAIVLVILVVFMFLQNWRATLIPCLAVPVSLIGSFAGMYALGTSINLATLFAMVLSIGIVVDDAIVVLENVERHMREGHMSAREATHLAMKEVTGPLIAIVLVLTAVFLPVAFLGGLVGEMYRQFAVTLSVAVAISGFVALTLTPALCALLLRPRERKPRPWLDGTRALLERFTLRYAKGVGFFLRHGMLGALFTVIVFAATWQLSRVMPTSLVPDEDQGYVMALPFLPPAASLQRTDAVTRRIDNYFAKHPAVFSSNSFVGFDPYSFLPRSNSGLSFICLKHWDERTDPALQAPALVGEIFALGEQIKDAVVFGVGPPPIEGLSATGGFEGVVQSHAGTDYKALEAATAKLVEAAAKRPEVAGVFTTFSAQVPQLRLDIDRERAKQLGVQVDDIFSTLQSTFGAYYVNDFNLGGRVYRVQMQSDASYRAHIEDLRHVFVRSQLGKPIPLSALGESRVVTGADVVEHFNALPAARLIGAPAPGYSSGQALAVMEEIARESLPEGYSLAWATQAFLEKQTQSSTTGIYLLAILMVFLILTAQYERLTLPIAVILPVPFAVFGAMVAMWSRGLYNDLYLQIGIITLVGLSAKNAILIVEFASRRVKEGMAVKEAAMEAARLRFRPILMTSLAFIFGVLPLALSSGAGANSRHSIGTGVVGGMLAATFVATFFIPLFYVWAEMSGRWLRAKFTSKSSTD